MTSFVLVTGDFVPTGGMDRANFALAHYLATQGHQVHLVTHRAHASLLGQPNVQLHRVPKPAGSYLFGGPLLDRAGAFWARRLAARGSRVVVNGGNCLFGDVNWVHYVHAAYSATPRAGVARTAVHHLKHRIFLRAERRALSRARVVLANSQATRTELLQRFDLDPARVRVVYYGIDPGEFRPADPEERARTRRRLGWDADRPLVAFIGALGDDRKGFDTLFAAWQLLCARPDWQADLVVIGAGAQLPVWQGKAAAAGLTDRLHFLGFRADVPELLRTCDALVSPTRYEAYGLNVHETLCCGLPAFVSRQAGVAERYPEELQDLLLPDPEDGDDLARRLRAWAASPGRFRPALLALSQSLRSHTWDRMAETICKVIETAA